MNLLDFYQKRITRKTVADFCVEECDDRKDREENSSDNPPGPATRKVAECQTEQYTADEDYSSRCPILLADFVEGSRSAFQPGDLFLQLHQTDHVRVTITRWERKMKSPLDRLKAKAADWNVTVENTLETPTSLIGFGVRAGVRVVLKITKTSGDESHSGKVLRAFGDGAVRVYESETDAVLLERLDPGDHLVDLVKRGEDEEATRILAQVIAKLAHHDAPPECPTVADWGRGFDRYLERGDQQIPRELVLDARRMYQDLASSQRTTMLLHGDLQHYNVLFDNKRGWVAIDPKGVVGELEYEVGALLRNPVELPELYKDSAIFNRRLEILITLLHLDHSRALNWARAQSVLSEIWKIEDGS